MSDAAGPMEFSEAVRRRLDRIADGGRTLAFWWRDDDAVAPSDALDRLIGLAEQANVPVGLAVIPKGATKKLAARLADAPLIEILQHGWQHKNHQPAGSKATELGDARPLETVLGELRDGNKRLKSLFGKQLKPVLVPPWNRIAPDVASRRGDAGLIGLSTFNATDQFQQVNCHLDPIAWKSTRGFIGWQRATHLIIEELDRRVAGDNEPLGLLTHHLVHDDALWSFVGAFLDVCAHHPAIFWPRMDALFGL